MNSPSIEQQKIIDALHNSNVLVDAVAGSGKTTTVLHIALQHSLDTILLLTYNKKLRLETKRRSIDNNITNLDVHNYHSFAVKYYDPKCHNDIMIKKHLESSPVKVYKYTMVIIDEAQDMTELYYKLTCKIIKENNFAPKICILGDRYQSIYDFNGADNRYIIYGQELFNVNEYPWSTIKLSETFRVPHQISEFINKCALHEDRLISTKTVHVKPLYLYCDAFGKRLYTQVLKYLNDGYSCEDIFVVAPLKSYIL